MNAEDDDFNGEGARPSSLIPVHKLATRDPMHDLQLLRDVAIINERVRRELGPMPRDSSCAKSYPQEHAEKVDMGMKELMALAAFAGLESTSVTSGTDASSAKVADIPASVAQLIGDDKELLAYRSYSDKLGGNTVAIVLRHPKAPAPNGGFSWRDVEGFSCELVLLREADGDVTVTGRSAAAVDCENNRVNLLAGRLELNDQLELSATTVSFTNELTPLGYYRNSFAATAEGWHLAEVTLIYTESEADADGVAVIEESASYPKDIGSIPMEEFDRKKVEDVLYRNRRAIP